MSRRQKVHARANQAVSQQRSCEYETEKAAKFQGSAKVALHHLSFDTNRDREDDPKNEAFLIDCFERNGCVPLDQLFHIPALISQQDLRAALSLCEVSAELLLDRNPVQLPHLKFDPDFRLQCLTGKHRVEAAKKSVANMQTWWVIDLYTDDASDDLKLGLTRQGTNERPRNQGEVFCHILQSRKLNDPSSESFWWTRLQSPYQKNQVKTLLGRPAFRAVLEDLSEIPALFPDFRTGMIGTMLRLKADDEVIHALSHVRSFWVSLLNGIANGFRRLELRDVKALELRIPAVSKSDRTYLEPLVTKGDILRRFTPAERSLLWHRVLRYAALVPSLYTFFENFKYLMAVMDCLRKLVYPDVRQTIAEAFHKVTRDDTADNNVDDEDLEYLGRSDVPRDTLVDVRYRKVVLQAMRQLEDLRQGSVRLEDDDLKVLHAKSSHAWHEFATIANGLGFKTIFIEEILLQDPDRAVARDSLLLARRSDSPEQCEIELGSYITEIAAIYARLRKDEQSPRPPEVVCDGLGESLERRCGLPFREAYESSRYSLLLTYMQRPEPPDQGEITPFFVRKDIFLSFWGRLNFEPANSATQPNDDLVPSGTITTTHDQGELSLWRPITDHEDNVDDVVMHMREVNSGYASSLVASSHYSQEDDESVEEVSFRRSQALPIAGTEYSAATSIRFMLFVDHTLRLVHEELVVDHTDPRVEQVARRYGQQGLVTLDTNFRSLAPAQCLDSALGDQTGTLILLTHEDWVRNVVPEVHSLLAKRKRASSIDSDDARPHKTRTIGPSRFVPVE